MVISNMLSRQRGLSLVELMIAMALGLVLILGVGNIFVANRITINLQEGMAHIQETGRFAIHRIGKSIHGAGYFGCMGPDITSPKVIAEIDATDTDPPNPELDLINITAATAVSGLHNVTATNDYDAAPGTDVLILRGSGDEGAGLVGVETAKDDDIQISSGYSDFSEGELVIITDCEAADLLRSTEDGTPIVLALSCASGGTCNTADELTKPYGEDAYVLKPYIHAYYVMDTGRNNEAGDNIFSLWMRDIDGNDEEIVEGVSNLQVTYGLDRINNDNATDIYMDAAQVTAANAWGDVVTIRVSLLVDSVEDTLSQSANFIYQESSNTSTDRRQRNEFSGLFSLRNRTL